MTDKATSMVRIADPKDPPKVCVHAFNTGDIDGLANLFGPAAMIISPPGQVVRGSAEIREVFTRIPASGNDGKSS
jgi:ketosteroid isomerase-like protein